MWLLFLSERGSLSWAQPEDGYSVTEGKERIVALSWPQRHCHQSLSARSISSLQQKPACQQTVHTSCFHADPDTRDIGGSVAPQSTIWDTVYSYRRGEGDRESEGKSRQVVSDPVVAVCCRETPTRLKNSSVCEWVSTFTFLFLQK
jgi:hypothetical protein